MKRNGEESWATADLSRCRARRRLEPNCRGPFIVHAGWKRERERERAREREEDTEEGLDVEEQREGCGTRSTGMAMTGMVVYPTGDPIGRRPHLFPYCRLVAGKAVVRFALSHRIWAQVKKKVRATNSPPARGSAGKCCLLFLLFFLSRRWDRLVGFPDGRRGNSRALHMYLFVTHHRGNAGLFLRA